MINDKSAADPDLTAYSETLKQIQNPTKTTTTTTTTTNCSFTVFDVFLDKRNEKVINGKLPMHLLKPIVKSLL